MGTAINAALQYAGCIARPHQELQGECQLTEPSAPVVSVLMTAYNREAYIGQAIESVLASDFEDFELIVVDDGSRDRTIEVARSYEANDARVRVYQNERNLGDYPNRNKAAGYARGAFLKYVDSDDLIYPWGLRILVSCMGRFPEAAYGLCSLDQDDTRPYPFVLSPTEAYERHYFGPYLFHKSPLSSIIRRRDFQLAGGFSGRRMTGDVELWHRLSARSPVVLMPGGLVWYREHPHGEMEFTRNDHSMQLKYWTEYLRFLTEFDVPLSEASRRRCILALKKRQARFVLRAVFATRFRELRSINESKSISWMDVLLHAFLR